MSKSKKMNVVFRVDASLIIGTGHVMRCLTLADSLAHEGAQCYFVCRVQPGHLLSVVQKRGHRALALRHVLPNQSFPQDSGPLLTHAAWLGTDWQNDANDTLYVLKDIGVVDWLVIDHYALDHRWEQALRPSCNKLFVIDDLADRHHACDALLDQNWFGGDTQKRYQDYVPDTCECFLGPQYALLKPEYAQLRALMPPRDGIVRRVLVCLGGSDPTNETKKVLEALMLRRFEHLAVDIVLGMSHSDPSSIRRLAEQRPMTSVYKGLPSLSVLMIRADLMIGAGGSTTWERMCLGLPAIVISIAKNQSAMSYSLHQAGYISFLGYMSEVGVSRIAKALEERLSSPKALKKQSQSGARLVPGSGSIMLVNFLVSNR